MKSLAIIKESSVVSDTSIEQLNHIKDKLRHNFETNQIYRSRYQMESILNDLKFPTPDAKYWQAVREQQAHLGELVVLSFNYRRKLVELKRLHSKKEATTDILDNELLDIEEEEIEFSLANMRKVAEDRVREIVNWQDIMNQLEPHLKYGKDSYEKHHAEATYLRAYNQLEAIKKLGHNSNSSEIINLAATADFATKNLKKLQGN